MFTRFLYVTVNFTDFWGLKEQDVHVQELDLLKHDTHEDITNKVLDRVGHVREKYKNRLFSLQKTSTVCWAAGGHSRQQRRSRSDFADRGDRARCRQSNP